MPYRRFAKLALLTSAGLLALSGPAAAKKDQPDGTVSEIGDERIQESSGLAVSMKHNGLVYTMNDEGGSDARVFAIELATGNVVGTADISGLPIKDPESIAIDAEGTLWLGDLGDNDHGRDDVAIYAFPEPGRGERAVSGADRFQVTLPGGPQNVEGLMVHPQTGKVFIVSKNEDGNGRIYELPALQAGGTIEARDVGEAPEMVTDATFTHSGQRALLRTEDELWVYDPQTWQAIGKVDTPDLKQGESVTVERGDRSVLLGSEGKNSPIVRMALPDTTGSAPIELDDDGGPDGLTSGVDLAIPLVLVAAALLVAGLFARKRLRV